MQQAKVLREKDFAVVDFSELYSKLQVGNRIIVDFGAVCMSVIGFEDESEFLNRRQIDDVCDSFRN